MFLLLFSSLRKQFSLDFFLIFSSFDLQLDVLAFRKKICETIGSENDFESELKMRNNIKEHPFPFQRYFVLLFRTEVYYFFVMMIYMIEYFDDILFVWLMYLEGRMMIYHFHLFCNKKNDPKLIKHKFLNFAKTTTLLFPFNMLFPHLVFTTT